MSKEYGLILPKQMKKALSKTQEICKPSVFNQSSESDDNDDMKFFEPTPKKASAMTMMERRTTRRLQEKALEDDPTVFQYDELYDEMETKREDEKTKKNQEPKKPKYISRLIEYAEKRKLENELRIERQVQKEREQEGEEFKEKESFVTEAYKKKLEERRKLEEQEQRDEYLERIGDVTKQKDLDGFYRHLYEQKLGTTKQIVKPELTPMTKGQDIHTNYKPIKSVKPPKRHYRKRRSSNEEDEDEPVEMKKVHLQNNIDADSDFSIDSSSDEEGNKEEDAKPNPNSLVAQQIDKEMKSHRNSELNLDTLKEDSDGAIITKEIKTKDNKSPLPVSDNTESIKIKIDRSKIWEKRTVGEAFDEAVKRYFKRKAARTD